MLAILLFSCIIFRDLAKYFGVLPGLILIFIDVKPF
jgi:hypothetical protein